MQPGAPSPAPVPRQPHRALYETDSYKTDSYKLGYNHAKLLATLLGREITREETRLGHDGKPVYYFFFD